MFQDNIYNLLDNNVFYVQKCLLETSYYYSYYKRSPFFSYKLTGPGVPPRDFVTYKGI